MTLNTPGKKPEISDQNIKKADDARIPSEVRKYAENIKTKTINMVMDKTEAIHVEGEGFQVAKKRLQAYVKEHIDKVINDGLNKLGNLPKSAYSVHCVSVAKKCDTFQQRAQIMVENEIRATKSKNKLNLKGFLRLTDSIQKHGYLLSKTKGFPELVKLDDDIQAIAVLNRQTSKKIDFERNTNFHKVRDIMLERIKKYEGKLDLLDTLMVKDDVHYSERKALKPENIKSFSILTMFRNMEPTIRYQVVKSLIPTKPGEQGKLDGSKPQELVGSLYKLDLLSDYQIKQLEESGVYVMSKESKENLVKEKKTYQEKIQKEVKKFIKMQLRDPFRRVFNPKNVLLLLFSFYAGTQAGISWISKWSSKENKGEGIIGKTTQAITNGVSSLANPETIGFGGAAVLAANEMVNPNKSLWDSITEKPGLNPQNIKENLPKKRQKEAVLKSLFDKNPKYAEYMTDNFSYIQQIERKNKKPNPSFGIRDIENQKLEHNFYEKNINGKKIDKEELNKEYERLTKNTNLRSGDNIDDHGNLWFHISKPGVDLSTYPNLALYKAQTESLMKGGKSLLNEDIDFKENRFNGESLKTASKDLSLIYALSTILSTDKKLNGSTFNTFYTGFMKDKSTG